MQVTKVMKLIAPPIWQQSNCPFLEGRVDLKPLNLPFDKEVSAPLHYGTIMCTSGFALWSGKVSQVATHPSELMLCLQDVKELLDPMRLHNLEM